MTKTRTLTAPAGASRRLTRRQVLAGGAVAAAGLAAPALAQRWGPGVSADAIRIGNIMPYSGPAAAYGVIGAVEAAYFRKLNDEGGVNGRRIDFISYDDGYSPARTVQQARRLVERDEALLIFSSLGTPTNAAIHAYMNEQGAPQLFVAAGASKWGQPERFPWTMPWQPDYRSEARIYARFLLEEHPDARIAVLYQNDDYGQDYRAGLRAGLGDAAERIVAEEPYEVSDPVVDSQMVRLRASGADVFFNVATPRAAAQAIRKAAELDWRPLHLLNAVANGIASTLAPAGAEAATGVISAGYMKDATDPSFADDPGLAAWRAFMDAYYPNGDRNSTLTVYGYSAARTLEWTLRQAGDDLTRGGVMAAATSMQAVTLDTLLPGVSMTTSPTDYFPLQSMQLQRFDGEKYVRFGPVRAAETA